MTTATVAIHARPALPVAVALLEFAELPTTDLTEAHLEHFFWSSDAKVPVALVGLEPYGKHALLRSLVVASKHRSRGLGAELLRHAEAYARSQGVQSLFLLTTTAEAFFARHGFVMASRESAPAEIKSTREFAGICPASSAFMFKAI